MCNWCGFVRERVQRVIVCKKLYLSELFAVCFSLILIEK